MENNYESFEDAYAYLQLLVKQIESDQLPLDQLSGRVLEARKFAAQCEAQLRDISTQIAPDEENDNS